MKLDVVVPTYNRADLLQKTVSSLLRAPIPADLDVTIVVVDNNSKDATEKVVREIQSKAVMPVVYVKEMKQGCSSARNAGVRSGSGEIIGFIDDDEEIHPDWFRVVAREFADPATEFIGGPYLANGDFSFPTWLPAGYHAAIGVLPPKPRSLFDESFPGILMGGNVAIRRSVFDCVGLYSEKMGRSGKGLLSSEDEEFYRRLRKANVRGVYVPDFIIYHYVPASRLTRSYHRRWCFWRGASQGVMDRDAKKPVRYLLGIPRFLIGRAVYGLASIPRHVLFTHEASKVFAAELALLDLLGFAYGKFFLRLEKYYGKE
jgi:glycosyltransferase involved in cell wall biosynthesis